MKYIILENENYEDLAVIVSEQMYKGYMPIGGNAVYYDHNDQTMYYSQAMILTKLNQITHAKKTKNILFLDKTYIRCTNNEKKHLPE